MRRSLQMWPRDSLTSLVLDFKRNSFVLESQLGWRSSSHTDCRRCALSWDLLVRQSSDARARVEVLAGNVRGREVAPRAACSGPGNALTVVRGGSLRTKVRKCIA